MKRVAIGIVVAVLLLPKLAASQDLPNSLSSLALPPVILQMEDMHDMHEDAMAGPHLVLKGFSDISYGANQDKNHNTFALGQFDFFVTSELSDKVSFLGEVVFKYTRGDNKGAFDIERVQIKYSYSDQVNVVIGRMHTPLGYWNETYHHGTWFQTTAFRPLVEDRNILPQHEIGAQFTGVQKMAGIDLNYNVSVANGRGRSVTENENLQDYNGNKAFNLLLSLDPDAVPGLRFGFNTYIDTIPADPTIPARNGEIKERILGGHFVYIHKNIEYLTEYANIRHEDGVSGKTFNTNGFYIQGAYQFNKWKPYYRYDHLDFGQGDPYYASLGSDLNKHSAGLRWDIILWLCLKAEYGYNQPKGADNFSSLTLQTAFTF